MEKDKSKRMKKLTELREECGIKSIKQACRLTNTPYSTWVQWENGLNGIPEIVFAYLRLYLHMHQLEVKVMNVFKDT